ncbi:hypothetical protein LZ554_003053 [Drepanopeziza brunnea f. sp. 'monogermtubi']|nr:hypothetical protein LZ554_003053 [Drepanopeziza brunnea f. sp. 'monogermtubi']
MLGSVSGSSSQNTANTVGSFLVFWVASRTRLLHLDPSNRLAAALLDRFVGVYKYQYQYQSVPTDEVVISRLFWDESARYVLI